MMNINIVCVGKLKEDYLRMACAEYEKRLGAFCRLKITELTPTRLPEEPNPAQISAALAEEGKRILACVKPGEAVFTLCIEGKELPSEGLAKEIEKCALAGFGSLCFIIGGSHGLAPEVKAASRFRLSMSPMTFPHQLARVMLLEQIYRAFMITNGGKYHK